MVDPALHSAADSAEVVDMDTMPAPPHFTPATPLMLAMTRRQLRGATPAGRSIPSILKNNMSSLEGQMAYYNFCATRKESKERERWAEEQKH